MPGATYAGALAAVANGIAGIGAAARSAAADLKTATAEASRFREEVETARNTTAGISSAPGSVGAKSLGAALKSQAGR